MLIFFFSGCRFGGQQFGKARGHKLQACCMGSWDWRLILATTVLCGMSPLLSGGSGGWGGGERREWKEKEK